MPSSAKRAPRHAQIRHHLADLGTLIRLGEPVDAGTCLSDPANDNRPQRANDNQLVIGSDTHFDIRPSEAEIFRALNGSISRDEERAELRVGIAGAKLSGLAYFELRGLRFRHEGVGGPGDDEAPSSPRYPANELLAYRTGGGTWSRPRLETSPENGYAPQGRRLHSRGRVAAGRRAKQPAVVWTQLPDVLGHVPLDQARINAGLSPSPKCPSPAYPHQPQTYRELFMGGQVGRTGKGGGSFAAPQLDRMIARQDAKQWRNSLSPEEALAVERLQTAKTYGDLSQPPKRVVSPKTLERRGHNALLSAVRKIRAAVS